MSKQIQLHEGYYLKDMVIYHESGRPANYPEVTNLNFRWDESPEQEEAWVNYISVSVYERRRELGHRS